MDMDKNFLEFVTKSSHIIKMVDVILTSINSSIKMLETMIIQMFELHKVYEDSY